MGLLQTALTAIYPPRCLGCGEMVDSDFGLCGACWGQTAFVGGTVCDICSTPLPGSVVDEVVHCDVCLRAPKPWKHGRAALIYTGMGRKLVLRLKHGDRQEIAKPAAGWMRQAVMDMAPENALIAPVPLHWMRLAKRRYNQSALIAKSLSDMTGLDACPDLLERPRKTPSLDGKTRGERADILDGAIRINPRRRHRIINRTVVLVDDVMTTGATLSACAEACRAAGATDVCVAVLARVAKDA
ncbi:ComF family protein [uncultured Tateyamaria sp.]|uniref:ComF family protein n=1 Tax=uncultured Tateyamaria sp. TaxID=455651 RepID=UPI00262EA270|nr:ComF family protein [uncultured Tateyamaria sp.]